MVLVTGPTGSGKTTTLYSALSELNKTTRTSRPPRIPVEFNLGGINQVQMHEDIGLNFAAALRSFLRQDPDIIMVGEIRDFETAEIAVKAALTGHLVLSTLHTNEAARRVATAGSKVASRSTRSWCSAIRSKTSSCRAHPPLSSSKSRFASA